MSARAVPYLWLVAPAAVKLAGAAGAAGTDGADRSPPGPRAEVPAALDHKDLDFGAADLRGLEALAFDEPCALDGTGL